MTQKQEKRFFKDMEDPAKQEKYIQFVEAEEAKRKAKEEEVLINGD
jgi:hypothetical protein